MEYTTIKNAASRSLFILGVTLIAANVFVLTDSNNVRASDDYYVSECRYDSEGNLTGFTCAFQPESSCDVDNCPDGNDSSDSEN